MDPLIDDLEELAIRLADDPIGSQLLPQAIAALRAGKADPATAFDLALLAECENAEGRLEVGALLEKASKRLQAAPSRPEIESKPRGRLH